MPHTHRRPTSGLGDGPPVVGRHRSKFPSSPGSGTMNRIRLMVLAGVLAVGGLRLGASSAHAQVPSGAAPATAPRYYYGPGYYGYGYYYYPTTPSASDLSRRLLLRPVRSGFPAAERGPPRPDRPRRATCKALAQATSVIPSQRSPHGAGSMHRVPHHGERLMGRRKLLGILGGTAAGLIAVTGGDARAEPQVCRGLCRLHARVRGGIPPLLPAGHVRQGGLREGDAPLARTVPRCVAPRRSSWLG